MLSTGLSTLPAGLGPLKRDIGLIFRGSRFLDYANRENDLEGDGIIQAKDHRRTKNAPGIVGASI